MNFSQRSRSERMELMGDEAEIEFEHRTKLAFTRSGHKRPKVRDMHAYEWQRPDYIVDGRYIEVMGMGEDQILKLKIRKLEALHFWILLRPVTLWIWDSSKRRCVELPLARIDELAVKAKIAFFPEGTPYYELQAQDLFREEAA
jgi:hypothetical protein